jgi:dihydroorotate dehydrogenase
MARLLALRGIWNRLGFTSAGLLRVESNLREFPRDRRQGMIVACNIGPHPGNLKHSTSRQGALAIVERELTILCRTLYPHSDLFVINLSSPNTPGLRSLLQAPELVDGVVRPIHQSLRQLDVETARCWKTPLLVKLPPEDENRQPWTESSLAAVVSPLLAADACDGFVAVNTSTRLAQEHVRGIAHPELPGGVSGEPLRKEALNVVQMLRPMLGPQRLLIGCGGVMEPAHARQFLDAGADLVEIYSGMIYAGPGLIARAADACISRR